MGPDQSMQPHASASALSSPPSMPARRRPSVCYICAPAHSGSTLLDMLLGGHSEIASLGEFAFLGKTIALRELCSCQAPVAECAAWAPILDRIQRERGTDLRVDPYALWQWDTRAGIRIDRHQQTRAYLFARKLRVAWCAARSSLPAPLSRAVPLPPSLDRGVANSLYLYRLVRQEWGVGVVVDSSKNTRQALALYERAPEEVRIISLVRDGRGVFRSHRSRGFSRRTSLGAWSRHVRRMLPLIGRSVDRRHVLSVRYEELVSDPGASLSAICTFLDRSFEPTMLDLAGGVRHNIGGNVGSRVGREKGVRHDERWRTDLSAEDLAYFERHGGDINRRLGYR